MIQFNHVINNKLGLQALSSDVEFWIKSWKTNQNLYRGRDFTAGLRMLLSRVSIIFLPQGGLRGEKSVFLQVAALLKVRKLKKKRGKAISVLEGVSSSLPLEKSALGMEKSILSVSLNPAITRGRDGDKGWALGVWRLKFSAPIAVGSPNSSSKQKYLTFPSWPALELHRIPMKCGKE